ncbi:baeRF2 domain-containing protein [Clavibacter sp. km3a]|uniref:baeRF2 domain-containing protein n=1 Tax=Clavibacter sp. km3a TaxID=3459135 RepID=UPI0040423912
MTDPTPDRPSWAELLRRPGPWVQVHLDDSVDTADPPQVLETRRKSVIDRLARDGASEEDLAQVSSALAHEPAPGGPRTRVILVESGELVVDESIPGIPTEPEEAGVVPVPDLVPLLEREPERIVYVVVETSRDGGEVRVLRAGPDELIAERAVEGRTDTLHPVKTGGWRQDRLQHHAEEIWRQTQGELAERIDDVVRRHRPRLLVVAGDIRARQLLEGELGPEPRAILAVEPTNTRADGADPTALEERIRTELQRILAEGERDVLDRVAEHDGRGDGWAETRVGAVVRALASAQVDTLVLDADALRDERLLALSAAPWIATAPEDALGAEILGRVPAHVALTRAALLTDARVVLTDSTSAPDGEDAIGLPGAGSVAALLRWPEGPAIPGTGAVA